MSKENIGETFEEIECSVEDKDRCKKCCFSSFEGEIFDCLADEYGMQTCDGEGRLDGKRVYFKKVS